MNINIFLEEVCNKIKYKPAQKDISEELRQHMMEIKETYMEEGISDFEAEEKSTQRMGNPKELGKELNKIHKPKLNIFLLISISILIIYGFFTALFKQQISKNSYIGNMIINMLISLILSIFIYLFDYKKLKKYSLYIYIVASLLMILQFTKMAFSIDGKIFIRLFGVTFSPYLIALPFYITSFAGYLANYNGNKDGKDKSFHTKTYMLKLIFMSIFSIILFLCAHSYENAIILIVSYFAISYFKLIKINKCKDKVTIILFSVFFISILLLMMILFQRIKLEGINSYSEYNEAELIKSGQLFGETNNELFKNQEVIISENSNYTFTYLISKIGIIPTVIMIMFILLIIIGLLFNTAYIKEQYGKLIYIGFSILFIFESIGNIIMNLKGNICLDLNIPFVTYGSVYFIINICIFSLLLSIYRRKDINQFDNGYRKYTNNI